MTISRIQIEELRLTIDPCKKNECGGYDLGWNAAIEAVLALTAQQPKLPDITTDPLGHYILAIEKLGYKAQVLVTIQAQQPEIEGLREAIQRYAEHGVDYSAGKDRDMMEILYQAAKLQLGEG